MSAADIREAATLGASRLETVDDARAAVVGHVVERNTSWQYACAWADGLSDAELRAARKLKIPGDAGLAVAQARGRRRAA